MISIPAPNAEFFPKPGIGSKHGSWERTCVPVPSTPIIIFEIGSIINRTSLFLSGPVKTLKRNSQEINLLSQDQEKTKFSRKL